MSILNENGNEIVYAKVGFGGGTLFRIFKSTDSPTLVIDLMENSKYGELKEMMCYITNIADIDEIINVLTAAKEEMVREYMANNKEDLK